MFDETFNLAVALLLIAMGAYMLVLTRLFPLRVKTRLPRPFAAVSPRKRRKAG